MASMAEEVANVAAKIDGVSHRIGELEHTVSSLGRAVQQQAQPKAAEPDPRIDEIKSEIALLRASIVSLQSSKSDNGGFFFLLAGIFAVSLLASGLSGWFYKPAHKIDYSERVLYNQMYMKDGSSIGLFETEDEAEKIIENQRKYEETEKKKAQSAQ